MGFFTRLFSPPKHKESVQLRSTSGTVKARTTNSRGLNPAPPAPPKVPQSSRSISSTITTNQACFAPLNDIGSYRLGRSHTATSAKTSPVCLPHSLDSVERERPATSHATRTNPSFANHEFEASCVSSKPLSAYPVSPRAHRPGCAEPGNLDDIVHPAYRKKPKNDQNVRQCATDERTEHNNLYTSPREDQQRYRPEKNAQRKATSTSVLSTHERNSNESSLSRLPPQAKHSPSSQTIVAFSGTSPRRNQQLRRCKDGGQRRAANTANSPTRGQKFHEPPLPPLPPRPQTFKVSGSGSSPPRPPRPQTFKVSGSGSSPRPKTAESSGSGSSSTTVPTSDSLSLRGSTASTEFSDVEEEAAIATKDNDFLAFLRLGKNSGLGRSCFDWSLDEYALKFAKRCMRGLKGCDRRQSINAVRLLQIGIPFQETAVANSAEKAWILLSPDDASLHARHIKEGFCQYFALFYETLQRGKEIPYQIPVNIRAKIDPRYGTVWNMLNGDIKHDMAGWIDNLEGEKQGNSLIALLEIKMYTKDPLESQELLHIILSTTQVKSLRHVTEDQISNFFATFVRIFRSHLHRPSPNFESIGEPLMDYFTTFWSLCTAQYSQKIASNYLALFKATIRKLDNIDIPLCLWVFLGGSTTQDMEDPSVQEMYLAMQTELSVRLPGSVPWVLPIWMTMQFLDGSIHIGFFDIMHRLMLAQCGIRMWERVWRGCQRSERYRKLRHDSEEYQSWYKIMASNVIASRFPAQASR